MTFRSGFWFCILFAFGFSACNPSPGLESPPPASKDQIDDLVLIEFAAKLEEDYHRLREGSKPSAPIHPDATPESP